MTELMAHPVYSYSGVNEQPYWKTKVCESEKARRSFWQGGQYRNHDRRDTDTTLRLLSNEHFSTIEENYIY